MRPILSGKGILENLRQLDSLLLKSAPQYLLTGAEASLTLVEILQSQYLPPKVQGSILFFPVMHTE